MPAGLQTGPPPPQAPPAHPPGMPSDPVWAEDGAGLERPPPLTHCCIPHTPTPINCSLRCSCRCTAVGTQMLPERADPGRRTHVLGLLIACRRKLHLQLLRLDHQLVVLFQHCALGQPPRHLLRGMCKGCSLAHARPCVVLGCVCASVCVHVQLHVLRALQPPGVLEFQRLPRSAVCSAWTCTRAGARVLLLLVHVKCCSCAGVVHSRCTPRPWGQSCLVAARPPHTPPQGARGPSSPQAWPRVAVCNACCWGDMRHRSCRLGALARPHPCS